MQLPSFVDNFIHQLVLDNTAIAYLLVGQDGRVREKNGDLAAFGLAEIKTGVRAADQAVFLQGMLPTRGERIDLPDLELDRGKYADIHLLPREEGDWVILLDRTKEARWRGLVRQRSRELDLLRGKLAASHKDKATTPRSHGLEDLPVAADIDYGHIVDLLLMEPMDDGSFRLLTREPRNIHSVYPEVRNEMEGLRPDLKFPFVENFLIDAREIWASGTGRIRSGPWIETNSQGNEYVLEAVATCWKNEHILAIEVLDERYKQQHAFLQRGRESVLLRQRIEKAKEEAEQASKNKSDFLSSLSHELRTPLNAILGFSQLLESADNLEPEQKIQIGEIGKAGRHLLDLIAEVLDLAKIEAGRMDFLLEDIPVREFLDSCRTLTAPLARKHGIKLAVEKGCQIMIRADATRTKQVLLNLLSNAIKYNQQGGSVRVNCQPGERGRLRINIIDTGSGLDNRQQAHLFTPFERLSNKAGSIEGTGIGLTISKQLIEQMGGVIGVDSCPGLGSTFWIEIPLAKPHSQVGSSTRVGEEAVARDVGREKRGAPTASVLYVEDNAVNLMVVEHIIKNRTSFKLLSATTAEQGLALASATIPDLILLDINLPDMSGYEVVQRLSANENTRHIPVVAVSANAMPHDLERAKTAGFSEYLTKPLDIESFLAVIDRLLSNRDPR